MASRMPPAPNVLPGLLETLLAVAPVGLALLDLDLRFIYINTALAAINGVPAADHLGRPVREVLPQLASVVEPLLRRVIETGESIVDLEVTGETPAAPGQPGFFLSSYHLVHDQQGRPQGIAAVVKDITGRRQSEQRLAAQYAVSRVLAESADLDTAAPRLLQAIGEALEWDCGILWVVDQRDDLLRFVDIWRGPSAAIEAFEALSRQIVFERKQGLPGTVWASGAPAWIADILHEENFPRRPAAAAVGLRSGSGFPILSSGNVLGVFEFFSRKAQPPDHAILEMMAAFGSQIGQFIERDHAERAVRESEARKAAILQAALDAIITINHEGRIIDFNPAAERIFGYAHADAVGQDMATLIVPEQLRGPHRRGMARYLATGEGAILNRRIELTALRADGSEFSVELTVTRISSDGPPLFTGYIRDITERRRHEEIRSFLAEASATLAASLDYEATLDRVARLVVPQLTDWCLIYIIQADGQIRNVAMAHVIPAKEALLHELEQRYPLDPRASSGAPHVMRTGQAEVVPQVSDALLRSLARDGEHLRMLRDLGLSSYSIAPLIAGGRILGAVALGNSEPARHHTADLALIEELARRAALAIENARLYHEARQAIHVRDQFLSIASHELKTPLTSVLGFAELLQRRATREGTLPERDRRALQVIAEQAVRLNELVVSLLDLSRIEMGQFTIAHAPVDLGVLACKVVEEQQPMLEYHTIVCHTSDEPLIVEGDALRLEQVLQNLIGNAIKYSPLGGPIEVSLDREEDHARITVADHGIGIPESARLRLFERFYRANNVNAQNISGLGIGLYVVKEIVLLHGGVVEVESEEGQGSTFTVYLPLLQQ